MAGTGWKFSSNPYSLDDSCSPMSCRRLIRSVIVLVDPVPAMFGWGNIGDSNSLPGLQSPRLYCPKLNSVLADLHFLLLRTPAKTAVTILKQKPPTHNARSAKLFWGSLWLAYSATPNFSKTLLKSCPCRPLA